MLDALSLLSGSVSAAGVVSGQAIVATAASTNVIDLGSARDIGAGDADIQVHVDIVQAFNNLTSLQVTLQYSVDNATWTDELLSPVIVLANLVVGAKVFRVTLPMISLNSVALPRYVRLNYTVVGTAPTLGAITAYLTAENDMQGPGFNYPSGYVSPS